MCPASISTSTITDFWILKSLTEITTLAERESVVADHASSLQDRVGQGRLGVLHQTDSLTGTSAHAPQWPSSRKLRWSQTATAGSDVVQSGRPIFDDFFQHLWPYVGNNTANVVFQMVKRLWLIRIDQ
ncbi:hypothetical protein TNCV_2361421 [Trichonephila clavipes]|nr:hypothetical protein TNCV_2361421 [Trichonephila clavipes]